LRQNGDFFIVHVHVVREFVLELALRRTRRAIPALFIPVGTAFALRPFAAPRTITAIPAVGAFAPVAAVRAVGSFWPFGSFWPALAFWTFGAGFSRRARRFDARRLNGRWRGRRRCIEHGLREAQHLQTDAGRTTRQPKHPGARFFQDFDDNLTRSDFEFS
jgi:hypothetical protein